MISEEIDLSKTKLDSKEITRVNDFCKNLHNLAGNEIKSISLYGSAVREDYHPGISDINIFIVLKEKSVIILDNILDTVSRARRHGITPFFITEMNLRSSVDVFPIKFLAIQDSYQLLWGQDLLGELEITREHLRLRCEQEIKNLQLRMVQYFFRERGSRLNDFMSRVITGLLEDLRVFIALTHGDKGSLPTRDETLDEIGKKFDLDAGVLRKMMKLHDKELKLSREESKMLFNDIMIFLDNLGQIIDKMDN
ncbi:MAG: nucleotidyltransferase domain-containing protein [Candidatus Hodarchaeales archaeon]|jgi:predicted nucleotidyltransferase